MDESKKITAWLNLIDGSLSADDTVELPVLTGSMMPVLVPGRNIRIKRAGYSDAGTGDIIIFKDSAGLTAHRLLLKLSVAGKVFLYQKGDMNRFGSWIRSGDILGIVTEVQNSRGEYTDIASKNVNRNARHIALKQILRLVLNIILIIPRAVKGWAGKVKKNSV